MTQKNSKKLLQLAIEQCYDHDMMGQVENFMTFQSESVNKDVVMKVIVDELRNSYRKIADFISSDKARGDDKIFVGLVADTVTKEFQNQPLSHGVAQ